jgi:CheY-like chemotaxis protein/nitrogen-specific signal transduction histidine kinase
VRFDGITIDVTDRKRLEEERKRNLDLERSARTEAERISRMKDEFLATLSHELRTPLNAILGWTQLLRRTNRRPEDYVEGLSVIERNARNQAQLIEDLLDMSRIISGQLRLDVQPVSLAEIIHAAADVVRPAADAKRIRLQFTLDPKASPVSGDPARLQQIFWNLLSNSVKFTPSGGRVHVVLERVNSHIQIAISDTGQGIKTEFLPYVFERFRQQDGSIRREHRGLGLGLAIVKHLVEYHGGQVRAQSAGDGRGSTFTVLLPLAPLRAQADSSDAREHPTAAVDSERIEYDPPRLDGIEVLVVEDDRDSRDLLRYVLEERGANVVAVADASDAITRLAESRPDLLLSDIQMPNVDGYELIRRVRQLAPEQGGNVPAVAITAFARSQDRRRALLAGYQMHIAKPFEPEELVAVCASVAGVVNRPRTKADD